MKPVAWTTVFPALALLLPVAAAHPPGRAAVDGDVIPTGAAAVAGDAGRYQATIRRTEHGVPHIRAADLPSLGFGEGFAHAEDHLCTVADQVVRARGERARYFGRGRGDAHLTSDIVVRGLGIPRQGAAWHAAQPAEVRAWYEGYVAGYNHYLAETGRDAVPGWCRGEAWVVPITVDDLSAYHVLVSTVAPAFAAAIAGARPPDGDGLGAGDGAGAAAGAGAGVAGAGSLPDLRATASNAWALGRERTEAGGGMLLANPHYPWIGANRFWEKHLTVPGDLDVYGVNLIGAPGVGIGFNRAVAWTHTVSAGTRYTLYALDLLPGHPTRYRYGDEERDMVPVEVAVPVRGQAEPVRHTVWLTHYGPVLALGGLPWSDARAFALRDATRDVNTYPAQSLAMSRAGSMAELQRAHADHMGIPTFTTVAVSADGVAWFIDSAATPDLDDAVLADWLDRRERDPVTRQLWRANGLVLLDGSDPRSEWRIDPAARHPGLVPFHRLPALERHDYVSNANNSFWLANADAPLEGDYSPLHGAQREPLFPRTRANLLHLAGTAPAWPPGAAGRFDRRQVRDAVLGNRSLTADLLVPELVARCTASPGVALDNDVVDLARACRVLGDWDRRFDLDSRGAVLFREWIGRYPSGQLDDRGDLFAVGFDPDHPLDTPRGLAAGDLALQNLARAVRLLEERDLPLDVPLGRLQYAPSKLPRRIPVHGAGGRKGVLNLQLPGAGRTTLEPLALAPRLPGSASLTEAGYPVLHGASFLLVVEYTDAGPRADAILTYGQSGDPESAHFVDQTELFARKQWRAVPLTEEAIAAATRRAYDVVGDGHGMAPRP